MIVAMIGGLTFKKDVHRHTVYYAEYCERLQFGPTDRMSKTGSLKIAIADNLEDAHNKLSAELRGYLRSCAWGEPQLSDFTFDIYFGEITDGKFWWAPCTTSCQKFKILEEN